MTANAESTGVLSGRRIAVPESRQLDVFADLLTRRGADVLRCPLVAIRDAPDPAQVAAWLDRAIAAPPDLFVFYTGEGIRRLLDFAERHGCRDAFVATLASTKKLCRGPKPVRVLKSVGLDVDIAAPAPTTAGIIEALTGLDLDGRRICVQLYDTTPVTELDELLRMRGADADYVSPYTYASDTDDADVIALIEQLAQGTIDAIAFTSKSQVERLFRLARARGLAETLGAALDRICVAAVGPVAAAALEREAVRVDVIPERNFFMKPLVSGLAARLGRSP